MAPRPGLTEVRAWIDVPASELPDDQLALILGAEATIQGAYCRDTEAEDYPEPLAQALLRRCARSAAARGLPLGTLPVQMTGLGAATEYGAALLPRLDAEIERLEGPYRYIPVA